MAVSEKLKRATITVEEAARILGIGRSGAYEAARTGRLPTLRLGKRIVVPKLALARMLSGGETDRPTLKDAGQKRRRRAQ
jgi:excisionase family DNA binding protein